MIGSPDDQTVSVLLLEQHGDYKVKIEHRWFHRLKLAIFVYHPASGWNYRAAASDLRKAVGMLDEIIKEELK